MAHYIPGIMTELETLRGLAARQVEDVPVAPCGGLFPLTPALSLGERVNRSPRGEQSRRLGPPLRHARCSLSPRERVRVRGNGANDPLALGTIPELSNWTNSPARPEYVFTVVACRANGARTSV